ncbi:hypothetical protein AVEN_1376-1 [Araneus ventricosus]|uniref:Uncharacterized protein n=1 Tax=Araneus ventricosus TaxID=182803 RepID=A0A4Y2SGT0_ARAVE|nr:hypothetical protein AVEN_1376-1 [Araneus ventricosus]
MKTLLTMETKIFKDLTPGNKLHPATTEVIYRQTQKSTSRATSLEPHLPSRRELPGLVQSAQWSTTLRKFNKNQNSKDLKKLKWLYLNRFSKYQTTSSNTEQKTNQRKHPTYLPAASVYFLQVTMEVVGKEHPLKCVLLLEIPSSNA